MKSKLLCSLALVALLGAGCLRPAQHTAQPLSNPTPGVETAVMSSIVLKLNGGTAEIVRSGVTTRAVDGMPLLVNDRVMAQTGTVELIYPNAGASQLPSGSSVAIDSFTAIKLLIGSIWTRFEHVFGPGEAFSVKANGVVATVRGTGFGVSIEGKAVNVAVAEHRVEVSTETNPTRVYRVDGGQGVRVNPVSETFVPRLITPTEQRSSLYQFSAQPIPSDRLNVTPSTSTTSSGFVAPSRSLLPDTTPQDSTPSVSGTTSSPLPVNRF